VVVIVVVTVLDEFTSPDVTSHSYRSPADPLPRIESNNTNRRRRWRVERHASSHHRGSSRSCELLTNDDDDDDDTEVDNGLVCGIIIAS